MDKIHKIYGGPFRQRIMHTVDYPFVNEFNVCGTSPLLVGCRKYKNLRFLIIHENSFQIPRSCAQIPNCSCKKSIWVPITQILDKPTWDMSIKVISRLKNVITYIDICRRPNHKDRFAGKCRRDCVVLHLGAETDASHYHHPQNHSRSYFFSILQSMSWKS